MTNADCMRAIALLLLAHVFAGCTTDRRSVGVDATNTGSMLIHSGAAHDFRLIDCVSFEGYDTASNIDVSRVVMRELSKVGVRECGTSAPGRQLRAFYQGGPGVCIDCDETTNASRSAFALISVEHNGTERARAEWQYIGGGTADHAASAFGRALVELFQGDFP